MEYSFGSLLTFGLPLVALPLLIHLINLRRHRHVQWAAMEFLLESQKKNRKWIVLQQLLLLLLRTAAVAAVVLMLAGPTLRSKWSGLLGQGATQHVFLLDDSFSMLDRAGEETMFARAKRAIENVLEQAAIESGEQRVTVLPFSAAVGLSAGETPAISGEVLTEESLPKLRAYLAQLECSETKAGPSETIYAAIRLPKFDSDEARIVYLVSDFRSREWTTEELVKRRLRRLQTESSQLRLVQCVETQRPNLAIAKLSPEAGIRGAGVETWFQVTVVNRSDLPATAVSVTLLQDDHKLPSQLIDEIPPKSEATRRFRVRFRSAGTHRIQATIENDALELDNTRYFACSVPDTFPVLVIDGSRGRADGFYLSTALQPGGTTNPGWSPRVEPPSYLRQHEVLDDYAAICLLDVARLDESEVVALEEYVQDGGGLGIYLGSEVQASFYNERLYRDATGLLPAPLDVPTQLLRDSLQTEADLVVSDHSLFKIYGGQRNSFLPLVGVDFYYAVQPGWRPVPEAKTRVLARLRNKAPFVLEKQLGAGRVILHLAKLSPKDAQLGQWTNWSLNPVFPIYANELIGLLSASRRDTLPTMVGDALVLELAEEEYKPELRIVPPRSSVEEGETVFPKAEDGRYAIDAGAGENSGIWSFQLSPREDAPSDQLVAVNVDTEESDLDFLDRTQLARELRGIDYEFSLANNVSLEETQLGGFQLGDSLLYTLAIVLLVEQWLAYRASYHGPGDTST